MLGSSPNLPRPVTTSCGQRPVPRSKELAELAGRRLQLVEQRTAEQNRLQLVRHRHVRSDIGRAVAGLKRRITGLDRKIADLIASSP